MMINDKAAESLPSAATKSVGNTVTTSQPSTASKSPSPASTTTTTSVSEDEIDSSGTEEGGNSDYSSTVTMKAPIPSTPTHNSINLQSDSENENVNCLTASFKSTDTEDENTNHLSDESEMPAGPAITPPESVVRRLTPLGKHRRQSSADEDFKQHELRKLQLLGAKVDRISKYTNYVESRVKLQQVQKSLRRKKLQRKLDVAETRRESYINSVKENAKNTTERIEKTE
ncbi:unnamed protein product [Ambrosiozyma monospora]|uniref:Unnamed protein product n=1 Tax=Ambrosiozyma monospora TaxID=43982 RepID=A0ACB5TN05_AMBMO|nr:unnamed protein product [Ambrosiozyma monospora]